MRRTILALTISTLFAVPAFAKTTSHHVAKGKTAVTEKAPEAKPADTAAPAGEAKPAEAPKSEKPAKKKKAAKKTEAGSEAKPAEGAAK